MNYYYYLTAAGKQISESLQQQFGGVLRGKEEFTDATLAQDFRSAELLVFVLATGIAVRKLAPLLRTKCTDPAVLVVSQDQRYVISLLSGHLGGANDWTRKIAAFLHAEPVITTATDLQGQLAFDEVAKNPYNNTHRFLFPSRQTLPERWSFLTAPRHGWKRCQHCIYVQKIW